MLSEDYFKSVKIENTHLEVYHFPTEEEHKEIKNTNSTDNWIRGFVSFSGDVYAWSDNGEEIIHEPVVRSLNLVGKGHKAYFWYKGIEKNLIILDYDIINKEYEKVILNSKYIRRLENLKRVDFQSSVRGDRIFAFDGVEFTLEKDFLISESSYHTFKAAEQTAKKLLS